MTEIGLGVFTTPKICYEATAVKSQPDVGLARLMTEQDI